MKKNSSCALSDFGPEGEGMGKLKKLDTKVLDLCGAHVFGKIKPLYLVCKYKM